MVIGRRVPALAAVERLVELVDVAEIDFAGRSHPRRPVGVAVGVQGQRCGHHAILEYMWTWCRRRWSES